MRMLQRPQSRQNRCARLRSASDRRPRHLAKLLVVLVALFPGLLASAAESEPEGIANLILVIGDGMGPQQIGLLESYVSRAPDSQYPQEATSLSAFMNRGVVGLVFPWCKETLVVDSACAASQLATGRAVRAGAIAVDAAGDALPTIVEKAARAGKATGLVTDARLTHATTAAFASHVPDRSRENEIALDLLESGVDLMLGGGIRHWIPASTNDSRRYRRHHGIYIPMRILSRREDEKDLLALAKKKGYRLVFDRAGLSRSTDGKILGLFANSGMQDGIMESRGEWAYQPTLEAMTRKAIEVLSANPHGFVLIVEAGQIDWAAHDNDAGTMLHELLRLDRALRAVQEFVEDRDDTLVVITGDHETGGFSVTNFPANTRLDTGRWWRRRSL